MVPSDGDAFVDGEGAIGGSEPAGGDTRAVAAARALSEPPQFDTLGGLLAESEGELVAFSLWERQYKSMFEEGNHSINVFVEGDAAGYRMDVAAKRDVHAVLVAARIVEGLNITLADERYFREHHVEWTGLKIDDPMGRIESVYTFPPNRPKLMLGHIAICLDVAETQSVVRGYGIRDEMR